MKKLNKKYYELISELEKSLNDFEVKEDKNLTKILTEYKDKIEKGS
ncbi:bacteriocin immunity protein [Clostridium thermobutyricum]